MSEEEYNETKGNFHVVSYSYIKRYPKLLYFKLEINSYLIGK